MREINKRSLIRPLFMRDREEQHRASTELELLFDLVVVIAIAMAADQLRHQIMHGNAGMGIFQFIIAFFFIWWPWNLFSWFASSFDNDDALYRVNVMVMMVGTLIITASLPEFFASGYMGLTFAGYCILRLSTAFLWLRVGLSNENYRSAAIQNVVGLVVLQMFWAMVVFALAKDSVFYYALFFLGVFGELLLPWVVERKNPKPWHMSHITERFGLLNIIVLGEILLSSSQAFEVAFNAESILPTLTIALCSVIIAFCMWWLYFIEENHLASTKSNVVFTWVYGHFIVFAACAAVGGGLGIMLDVLDSTEHLVASIGIKNFAVAIPVALYILGIWFVRDRFYLSRGHSLGLICVALIIAASGFLPYAYSIIAVSILLVVCLIMRLTISNADEAI